MPPEVVFEIAFAGRSNAGKSSTLNVLTGTKQIARTSKTPGHTRLLNFYELAEGGRFVDLPGYGYAKASKEQQRNWRRASYFYLRHRSNLAGVVLIADCRRSLGTEDQKLIDLVHERGLPLMILLNKIDKLGYQASMESVKLVKAQLVEYSWVVVQPFSAQKGTGVEVVVAQLRRWLGTR